MMPRRAFLYTAAAPLMPFHSARAQTTWRTFEITTRIELVAASGVTRAWLPLATATAPYQRVIKQRWTGNAPVLRAVRDGKGMSMLLASWPFDDGQPEVELTLTIATADRAIEWQQPAAQPASAASLQGYLQPTRLIPLDGIVRETALRITRNESGDVGKARAVYEWIVENTARDPDVRGCGVGDIRGMLETGNLRGKCADINALFVGLVRAAGVPARDVYGLRVAPSRMFSSLGRSGDVTTAQHCRAEFYSTRNGWVPVDPADVRKVILEEKGGLDLAAPEVQFARRRLFGAWEMNWIAFNDAHDVKLPEATGPDLPFFMYPQAESGGKRRDSLSPQEFRYRISAREI